MVKTVLVTGAGTGIGAACVRALCARGVERFALHCNGSTVATEELAKSLRKQGVEAEVFSADFSNPEAIENLYRATVERFGEVDGLVCNAGIILTRPLALTSLAQWHQVHSVNLDAAFLLTKLFSRSMMSKKRGSIVYISSDAAFMGDVFRVAYCSSKAALIGLCRSASRELAPMGIRVNAVAPGMIDTEMTRVMDEERLSKVRQMIPFGRFGSPDEVGRGVAFLLSDDAAYITGQVLRVDGALT